MPYYGEVGLSEFGALGFEHGYSLENPNSRMDSLDARRSTRLRHWFRAKKTSFFGPFENVIASDLKNGGGENVSGRNHRDITRE